MIYVGVLATVSGVGILGLWTMLLATHQVPELSAGDKAIWFHMAAEYLLGALLVTAGALLTFNGDRTAIRILVGSALGAMVYSTINSPGYYAREGKWGAVVGFGVLAVLGCAGIVVLLIG